MEDQDAPMDLASFKNIELIRMLDQAINLIAEIKSALDTDENGDGLVEAVRNAHRAELLLAIITRSRNDV